MSDTAAQELAQQLEKIVEYVRQCEVRIRNGEFLELEGLDQNVAGLCEAANALASDTERGIVAGHMEQLVNGLDKLAVAIKEQQDSINQDEDAPAS